LAIKSEWNYEEGQTTMRRTARVTLSEAEARELLAWLREVGSTNPKGCRSMNNEREEVIAGMRALADYLEANPAVPCPINRVFDVFVDGKEELNALRRLIGGQFVKRPVGSLFCLRKEFGPLGYELNIDRELICERVVTGKRVVPAVPEHEEEIIDWKCGSLLEAE
jgi:hypothetical protein